MPKWEGIEDASPDPQPVWMSRSDEDPVSKWTPLRKCDCRAINSSKVSCVFVEGGRSTAHIDAGVLTYNFGNQKSKIRRLTSAIWFYPKLDKLIPLAGAHSKADEERVEAFYKRVIAASCSLSEETAKDLKKEEILLEDGVYKVILVGGNNSWILRRRPRALISLEAAVDLQRGYGPYTVPGEAEEMELGPVKHLYFVIHGIGEAMWSRQEKSMIDEMDAIRTSIHKKQHTEWKKMCARATKQNEALPEPPNRIEFIPIEWFSHIHSASSTLKSSLTSSTLESIPLLRTIANDVVFDVLMYLTPEFCEKVLRIVTDQICDFYDGFHMVHPDFNGTCSIIGHSLGSVIAWDLLCILQDNINIQKKQQKENQTDNHDDNHGDSERLSYYEQSVVLKDKDDAVISNFSLPVAGENKMTGYQAYIEEEGDKDAARAGTWGPRLPQRMTKSIPFTPHATVFLGSPLGMFLTLRGAHPVFEEMRLISESASWSSSSEEDENEVLISPFQLPTGAIYNIFHPSDPVAYRIEPLLLSPHTKELPTPPFLVLQGKNKRFHIKAREFSGNVMKSISGMFQNNLMDETAMDGDNEEEEEEKNAQQKGPFRKNRRKSRKNMKKRSDMNKERIYNFPLGGRSDRVDFQVQTGVVENEYISAVSVHGNYFANNDIVDFLVECCTYE